MGHDPPALVNLIDNLSKLPGIGRKTAARLGLFLLLQPEEKVAALARSIIEVKEKIHFCSICHNFTEQDPCGVCRDESRNIGILCVVESPADLMAVESTGAFRGRYHVLGGVLSPLNGIGPEDLRIDELLGRVDRQEAREILLATGSGAEGEATANYLADLLRDRGVQVTRVAQGVPLGADLEYVDQATLKRALENRREA